MKKNILFVLTVFIFTFGYSQTVNDSVNVTNQTSSNGMSKIIFYRESSQIYSGAAYSIYANGFPVAKLKNQSYYVFECEPNIYNISLDKKSKPNVVINAEAGKTYYILLGFKSNFWTVTPELYLVDSFSAEALINNGYLKKVDLFTNFAKPQNRIGLNLGGGAGIKNENVLMLDNGDYSSMSYGGGVGFGLILGHQFGKYFDTEIGFDYQFSELSPSVSNAKMTFNRFSASITPTFVIPLKGGDFRRIKIGGGLSYFLSAKLKADLSKIPDGFKDTWTYNNPLGYHIVVLYEQDISDNWSFNMGIKWIDVSYKLTETQRVTPTDSFFFTPNGSGILFNIGVYYKF